MVTRRRAVSYRRVGSGSYGREADVVISMLMIRPRDRRNIIIMRPPGNGLGHGAIPHTGSALRFRRCQSAAHLTCNILRCCRHTSAIRQAPRVSYHKTQGTCHETGARFI